MIARSPAHLSVDFQPYLHRRLTLFLVYDLPVSREFLGNICKLRRNETQDAVTSVQQGYIHLSEWPLPQVVSPIQFLFLEFFAAELRFCFPLSVVYVRTKAKENCLQRTCFLASRLSISSNPAFISSVFSSTSDAFYGIT